jgi:CO/xanthine dehydrogenase Mo-binding subunit
MTLIGGELSRADAAVKATGAARYTADLRPPGLLHAVAVRSPLASGRLIRVGTEAAARAAGVARALTAADLPDRRWGTVVHDQPVLARDVVRFAGEAVALVVAETREAAVRAAALVEVELEPLPAAVRLEDALAEGAPEVHAGRPNALPASSIRRGDVDAALAAAAHTVTTRIVSHRVHQGYIEPRAALAEPTGDGGLVVTMTSQAPFVVRQGLAELLGLPMSKVVVKVPHLGGGFGGKLHLGLAPLAAVACLATGRPVQAVSSRAEEMHAANPRENAVVELTSGVDADGRIVARRARVHLDAGAYAFDTPTIASIAAMLGTGPYDVEAVDLAAAAVYTHTCPTGSFRGPSGPQMVYASEAHVEAVAAAVGLPALELRRRNILRSGARGPSGEPLPDVGMEDCLEAVAARVERWRAEGGAAAPGRRRGYGLACAWWLTSPSPSGATITMNEDGTAIVATGGTEIGTGAVSTGLAAVAADALGIPVEAVTIVSGSTADGPHDGGSKGSRTLYGTGNAVLQAAHDVVEQLKDEVAEQLEAAPGDLELADGRIGVRGSAAASVPVAEAVRGALNRTGPVVGSGRFKGPAIALRGSQLERLPFSAFNEPTFHCHGVELELDEETGTIEVLRYVAAHDVGRVVNPAGARGQVEGGVVQGLGYALSEVMAVDDAGLVRNANLVDYRLPTIADAPREIETVFVEDHPGPTGPYGAKGVGEAPVILPAAAVGAAVRDAVGAQPLELPLDPIRISDLLDGARV